MAHSVDRKSPSWMKEQGKVVATTESISIRSAVMVQTKPKGWCAWHSAIGFIWIPLALTKRRESSPGQLVDLICYPLSHKVLEPQPLDSNWQYRLEATKLITIPGTCRYLRRDPTHPESWVFEGVPGVVTAVQENSAVIWSRFLGRVNVPKSILPYGKLTSQLHPLSICRFDAMMNPSPENDGFKCVGLNPSGLASLTALAHIDIRPALGYFRLKSDLTLTFMALWRPSVACDFSPLDFCGPTAKDLFLGPGEPREASRPNALYHAGLAPNRLGATNKNRTIIVWEVIPPYYTPNQSALEIPAVERPRAFPVERKLKLEARPEYLTVKRLPENADFPFLFPSNPLEDVDDDRNAVELVATSITEQLDMLAQYSHTKREEYVPPRMVSTQTHFNWDKPLNSARPTSPILMMEYKWPVEVVRFINHDAVMATPLASLPGIRWKLAVELQEYPHGAPHPSKSSTKPN
jgi:hypothetical protein